MKVILTEKVKALGTIGEIVNVSAGFARNFLFPQKLALLADDKNSNILKDKQKALAKKIAAEKGAAEAVKKKLDGLTVELIKKVGSNGRLFGAVTSQEIVKELEKQGISVERRLLSFDGSIKSLGTYDVKAKLFNDVVANFKLKVAIDAAMAEQLKKEQAEAQKRNAEKKAKAEAAKAAAAAEAEAAANAE
ncbi:50S ribosomal protein L9 [Peredibacter sp. HCB2-198]|uniref:50S ribosomal protein L9 n=1 Tax=Peredibacter sp. HCB2-198 TaxID=3383025 RepID=UPI0038B44F20